MIELKDKKKIDVLIVCALKDEFDQLLVDGKSTFSGWEVKTLSNGRLIADALLLTSSSRHLSVRATWCSFMGREEASALTFQMLTETDFGCLAMTGICAGRRGKVELGDVVFADRLWSYDAGKIIKENGREVFQGDMLQYRPSNLLVQRMQNLTVDVLSWPIQRPEVTLEHQEYWVLKCLFNEENPIEQTDFEKECPDWTDVIQRLLKKRFVSKQLQLTESGVSFVSDLNLLYPKGLPKASPFSVHVAPIATGAAVIEDIDLFDKLSGSMRKVLAVDMESSALGAIGDINEIPVIVAKAVSDFGDTFKDDRYRHFASQASARAIIQFFRDNEDLFVSSKDRHSDFSTSSLIDFLSEEYPDIEDARAVWKRAGGANSDLSRSSRPKDMWLNIWNKSLNGAAVSPLQLLQEVKNDFPENLILQSAINKFSLSYEQKD